MNIKQEIQNILDRNFTRGDNAKALNELLDLFGVMHRSFQGTNGYAIEHLINDTYRVVDKIDGTVHHQGTKRDCEVYLNGV